MKSPCARFRLVGEKLEPVWESLKVSSYTERRRMQPFTGKGETFTAPALAHGRLYCRSYGGEVVCLQIGAPAK